MRLVHRRVFTADGVVNNHSLPVSERLILLGKMKFTTLPPFAALVNKLWTRIRCRIRLLRYDVFSSLKELR